MDRVDDKVQEDRDLDRGLSRRGFLQQLLGLTALILPNTASPAAAEVATEKIRLFLCGDVMTGRGIDQILPHPSQPSLYEPYIRDARAYVRLAEQRSGPIEQPVSSDYIWGAALVEWAKRKPDAKIINLETSITRSDDFAREKGIHYRMHPENIDVLKAAGIDICTLANNHVLDWGRPGLKETLATLDAANIAVAGAGEDFASATAPAVLETGSGTRVVVFSIGHRSSGVPKSWAATDERSGVYFLESLNAAALRDVRRNIERHTRPGDLVLVSLHWGNNWGYDIPESHRGFARALIEEAGVHLLHGHSSHHPRGIEIQSERPIFYGCGDFVNDYEGIGGYEEFRGDLALMYFADFDRRTLDLERLELVPLKMRKFRLSQPTAMDTAFLQRTLTRASMPFGTEFVSTKEGTLLCRT